MIYVYVYMCIVYVYTCICVNVYYVFIYLSNLIYWKSRRGLIPLTNIWRELDMQMLRELLTL